MSNPFLINTAFRFFGSIRGESSQTVFRAGVNARNVTAVKMSNPKPAPILAQAKKTLVQPKINGNK
jgi:hypothetical protein